MLDPEIPDERREQIASEARTRIESGGELKHDTSWGMRKLAYEIRQRTEADYRFFRFETEGELSTTLDHNLRIADGVLRFRIFKVDPRLPGDRPAGAASRAPRRPRPAALAARPGVARPRDQREPAAEEAPEPAAEKAPEPAPSRLRAGAGGRGGRPHPSRRPTSRPAGGRRRGAGAAGSTEASSSETAEYAPAQSRSLRLSAPPGGRERAACVLRLGSGSNESRKGLSEWPPPI